MPPIGRIGVGAVPGLGLRWRHRGSWEARDGANAALVRDRVGAIAGAGAGEAGAGEAGCGRAREPAVARRFANLATGPEEPDGTGTEQGRNRLLQQLPRDHHPLDLVGALVDLGDRGPAGSFRR